MSDKMQLPALMGHLHEASLLEAFAGLVKPGGVMKIPGFWQGFSFDSGSADQGATSLLE